MIKMCKVFIFPFCLLCTEPAIADYSIQNQSFSVTKTYWAAVSDAVPGSWLKLNSLKFGTASSINNALSPCSYQTFMCTAGSIKLGYNGKASYIINVYRYAATITDDAGNNYMNTTI